jgi:hypothetical protein
MEEDPVKDLTVCQVRGLFSPLSSLALARGSGGLHSFGGFTMATKEQVAHELDNLSDAELEQVAAYVAFLKFRARVDRMPAFDEAQLATLYSEFTDEDRKLAEEGMADYAEGLTREDIP